MGSKAQLRNGDEAKIINFTINVYKDGVIEIQRRIENIDLSMLRDNPIFSTHLTKLLRKIFTSSSKHRSL